MRSLFSLFITQLLFTGREHRNIVNMTISPYSNTGLQLELDVLQGALLALGRTTGLLASVCAELADGGPGGPDVAINIKQDDLVLRYEVAVKPQIDRVAQLALVQQQLKQWHKPALLVSQRISPKLAAWCREADLQFIDAAGNAYLRAPGLRVFVSGEALAAEVIRRPSRASSAASLRALFPVVAAPSQFVNASYRDIAAAAGVSLGAVSIAFDDLQRRGLIDKGTRDTERFVLQPAALLDGWVSHYSVGLEPRLGARRFSASKADWWQGDALAGTDACWGGEAAAAQITGYLRPAQLKLYLPAASSAEDIKTLARRHQLRADPAGDIEILNAFWHGVPGHSDRLVPAVLVYADLLATHDPRNLETAGVIREQHIELLRSR